MLIDGSPRLISSFYSWMVAGAVTAFGLEKPPSEANIREQLYVVLTEMGEGKYEEARSKLAELPRDAVIQLVVRGISDDASFLDENKRAHAYRILVDLNAVDTDAGFAQLVAGLRDPLSHSLCAHGLIKAPADKLPEVADRLAAMLVAEETTDREKLPLVKALGGIGKPASAHLESIERIFAERAADELLRGAAAFAMLRIGGLGYAVERFAGVDPAGQRAMLPYLARHIVETEMALGNKVDTEFTQHRREARKLVLPAMRSEDVGVRKAALEALPVVYGEEALIIRTRDDYEMDAEYGNAVRQMAMQESDGDLRERAAKMIDPGFVDLKVESILRRRARRESESRP